MPVSSVWFLGANTPKGFVSLYPAFTAPKRGQFYLVKGSPGCGKSTFFRLLSRRAEELGLEQEIILCSGDPDSLDGVYFPQLRLGYVDATAPHALEPTCPGAGEVYLDFSRYLDTGGLKKRQEAIGEGFSAYRAEYAAAYRYLASLGQLEEERRSLCAEDTVRTALEAELCGVLPMVKGAAPGGREERFLTGITCEGRVCLAQTLSALCPDVIAVESECALGGEFLRLLGEKARELGLAHISCPDPLFPAQPAALLFPSLGLGFLSWEASPVPLPEPCRILSPDGGIPAPLRSRQQTIQKELEPILHAIRECAVRALRRANRKHGELEALYHPFVDFEAISDLTARHTAQLETLCHALRT